MKCSKQNNLKQESISELKEKLLIKEEELSHFKEMYMQLDVMFAHTIPMCMIDKEFNIANINKSYSELFNFKPKSIIGSKCYDIRSCSKCHTSGCPITRFKKGKLAKAESECGRGMENEMNTPLMVIAKPFYDTKGKFAGAIETVHDITCRIKAENALSKNNESLNNILNTIQDGISVLDSDLNILKVNNTMEKWYPDQKMIGEKCYKIYHGKKRRCKSCPTVRSLETGTLEVEEVPHQLHNGETGVLEISSFPMKDEDGKISGVVEYIRDITERRRAEESRINLVTELHNALSEVKVLRGILPFCSYCKNIRDDKGYWEKVDVYLHEHSEADISHGICPDCFKKYYPEHYEGQDAPTKKKKKKK